MARLTRPLALAAGAVGTFAILCALLLLTAGANTATSGIQLLTVDTTTVGPQILTWFQTQLQPSGVLPENIQVDSVPGSLRPVYYRGDVPGTLTSNTSLTYDLIGQRLPPRVRHGDIWATEWAVITVTNGTGSAPVAYNSDTWTTTLSLFNQMVFATVAWNRTTSATIDPRPAAGLLITGTILQAVTIAALVAFGLGLVVLESNRRRGLVLVGVAAVSAILNLASAAYITQVLRSYGAGFEIGRSDVDGIGSIDIAFVPYTTSVSFWVLTWLNAICSLFVGGVAVGIVLMGVRRSKLDKSEKETHEEP